MRTPVRFKEKSSLCAKAALYFIYTFSTRAIENPDKVIYEQIKCEFTARRLTLRHMLSQNSVPTAPLAIFLSPHCASPASLTDDLPHGQTASPFLKTPDEGH